MNQWINLQDLFKIILPCVLILVSLILGLILEKYVLKNLKRMAQKTSWKVDDILVNSLGGFGWLWFVLGGLAFALPTIPLNPSFLNLLQKIVLATFLSSVTLFVARFSVKILRLYTTKDDGISPLTSLFELLTKIVIFSLGTLIILQSIGLQITPLLTALGIGGVSLGLALQSTLANLMSGINIIASGKVQPGDYLQLMTGESGYVQDVELKYTILEEVTKNILVIPNSHLIEASFRNYSKPDKTLIIPIEIYLNYENDLEKIERITLEVANSIMPYNFATKLDEIPWLRYDKFDYFCIKLIIYLKILEKQKFEHLKIKHKFLKTLHQAYQKEGIKIYFPYPLLPDFLRDI